MRGDLIKSNKKNRSDRSWSYTASMTILSGGIAFTNSCEAGGGHSLTAFSLAINDYSTVEIRIVSN